MAKSRQQKEDIVARLKDLFASAKSVVFAEQSALSVPDMEIFRVKARAEGLTVMIAKKTLATLAAKEAGFENIDAKSLPNSVMTVIGQDDEVTPARLVADFAKDHETVQIVGGVFEGAFASQEQMVALSLLPSKPELYAKLVGTLNAPISGFVTVLSGNMRGLVTALKQIQEKRA
jgi:large subunit ribosomal protein L10